MNSTVAKTPWALANQAYLVAEFLRLKRILAPDASKDFEDHADLEDHAQSVRATMDSPPAIDHLAELFGLSSFEREVILLCAGVEMDSELAALCGENSGNAQRNAANFGMAMGILSEPHWSALTPSRPLRRFHMVEVTPGQGLCYGALRLNERILHYLAGVNVLDPGLESLLDACPAPDWIAAEHKLVVAQATRFLEAQASRPLLHLCGDDSHGQEDVAAWVANEANLQLFVLRVEDLPAPGADLEQIARLWHREALLLPGALLLECGSGGLTASARHLAERLSGLVFLASREAVRLQRPFLRFDVDKPRPAEQRSLWEKALGAAAVSLNGALDNLSEQYRFSARTIFSTSALTASLKGKDSLAGDLWNVCRSLSRPRMEDLAERIVPQAGWDDLVLPESQKRVLRQLAAQVRHRMKVYESWGFSAAGRRGLGVSALFTGESGTGKTLAAEVLAAELALDLYRIDLSAVVSKYIGETEKNLRQVFDAAEQGGALLLFDEADALFGKRSDVKDSHDRYANIEVSYLLQRMEAYQGLAVLTTNLKTIIDKAFQRRLRFTIGFPFPDAALREAIWRRVFPARTPTRGLDYKILAQLNMTGGNIRNIAVNAAFLAAEDGTPVDMSHLLEAARLEAQKIERPLAEVEIRGWA